MKNLLLLAALASTPAFANHVPVSEAQRYIDAAPGGVPPLYTCADKPEEPCLDVTHVEDWSVVAIVDGKLVTSGAKLTERLNREAAQKAKADARKARHAALHATAWDDVKTIKDLKEVVKELMEQHRDEP